MDAGVDAMSSLLGMAASPLLQAANATANSTMTSATNSASGNMLLDALLLAAVPLTLQFLLSPEGLKDAWKRVRTALIGDEDAGFVFRDIKATTTFGEYYVQNEDENRHGHLLQKAILTHLADVLQSQLRGKDIRYEMIERELDDDKAMEVEETKSTLRKNSDEWADDLDQSEQYDAINRLTVGSMPKFGEWIEVQPKVFFQQCAETSDDDNGNDNNESGGSKIVTGKCKDVTSLFRFKSNAVNGTKKIDKLIEEAFVKFQLLELTKLANDKKKYMYVQTHKVATTSSGDDDNDNKDASSTTTTVVYKRYALGEEKTFKNLFFEEKESLVQLLDNFMAHSGKFAIKGFPYKLGLLLHGPPGTGKTSLIKAVAQHTKRHIVTISLGKIQTNQELMNALFDLRFTVEGVSLPVNMTFEDIVFVMEDIDCAASVVMARENKPKASSSTRNTRYKRSTQWISSSASDKLNLSGLLNVLDGVIDCPGRIVIMTTNHPEKLDPALIRPGRVNKKLELGYMSRENIQRMIEYYSLEKFTHEQEEALDRIVCAENAKITPATVEALSAEFDDVASVLNALQLLQSAQESSELWMS